MAEHPHPTAERDRFFISADPRQLDIDAIERLVRASYWAPDRPRDVIERSLKNSLCFGLYESPGRRQIGLMRVVTDYATFAWLCDVIVEEPYRGRGLGKWMLESVLSDPSLRDVGRWILATRDAHQLYEQHGFTPLARPDRWMERPRSRKGD